MFVGKQRIINMRSLIYLIVSLIILGCSEIETISNSGGYGGTLAGSGGQSNGGTNNSGSGGIGGSETKECVNVELISEFSLENAVDEVGSVNIARTSLINNQKASLTLEFYMFQSIQVAGFFDLSNTPDDNYSTCERCIRVLIVDLDSNQPTVEKIFYQKTGTMEILIPDNLGNGQSSGIVTNLTLVEVTINPGSYYSEEVSNGDCLNVKDFKWDLVTASL